MSVNLGVCLRVFGSAIELYAVIYNEREAVVYERNPIPGGHDMPVLCRPDPSTAMADAIGYVGANGSSFKDERATVGA